MDADIKNILLEEISRSGGIFSFEKIMQKIEERTQTPITQMSNKWEEVVSIWSGLTTSGFIASNNPSGDYRLTDSGKLSFQDLSRDPLNHKGYMANLDQIKSMSPIAREYAEEAIRCYQHGCFKGAAVLIGSALESVLIEIQYSLVEKISEIKIKVDDKEYAKLLTWHPKNVCEAIQSIVSERIEHHKGLTGKTKEQKHLLTKMWEKFESKITSSFLEIKKTRDKACHPNDLDDIKRHDVHANLIAFPYTVEVLLEIKKWIEVEF